MLAAIQRLLVQSKAVKKGDLIRSAQVSVVVALSWHESLFSAHHVGLPEVFLRSECSDIRYVSILARQQLLPFYRFTRLALRISAHSARTTLACPRSGYTTPCRMNGVTLHCHVRYKEI